MSIETYVMMRGKLVLYRLLDEGHTVVKEGRNSGHIVERFIDC